MTEDDKPDVEKVQALTTTKTKQEDEVEEGKTELLDEAELFLHEHDISHARLQDLMSDETKAKKLRRRIDYTLLPLLCGTYVLQYIDKQALSYSAVFDLFTDTNINSNQYGWLASIFYFGILAPAFEV